MHLTTLPQTLLLLTFTLTFTLTLPALALARPEPRADQIPLGAPTHHQSALLDPRSSTARQQRLEAWKAQKPMHTSALLAGAAATAVSESRLPNGRRRDLSCMTGEKGIWVPVEFWDEVEGVDERGSGGGGVRGEKALEGEGEGEGEGEVGVEDGDEGMESRMYGMKDVLERVWRKLERIGLVVQKGEQQMRKTKQLDMGHDGDL